MFWCKMFGFSAGALFKNGPPQSANYRQMQLQKFFLKNSRKYLPPLKSATIFGADRLETKNG